VVLEQLWADWLIRVQQDPFVGAASQTTGVLQGIASRVVLCSKISTLRVGETTLHETTTSSAVGLTKLAGSANVTHARRLPRRREGDGGRIMRLVIPKLRGAANC